MRQRKFMYWFEMYFLFSSILYKYTGANDRSKYYKKKKKKWIAKLFLHKNK